MESKKKISIQSFVTDFNLRLTIGTTFFAWMFGMLIACVVLNLYSGLSDYLLVKKDDSTYDYNIIHKKISLFNSMGLAKSGFSKSDLNDLTKKDFVIDATPLLSNQFRVGIDGGSMLKFRTELFLQSVPNKYLDIDTSGFRWREGEEVPIVVANSFIDLYNHGFSVSQGLPQLPKSLITKKTLYLNIGSGESQVTIPCRIYGFTNRISSIMVPQEFLLWGNKNFGSGKEAKPESVLIQSIASEGSSLEKLLLQKGYEYNKEMLNIDKTKLMIKGVLIFLIIISLLLIVLAVALSFFIAKTLLYEKTSLISHLFWLGYSPKYLLANLFKPILMFGVGFSLLSFVLTFVINSFVSNALMQMNFEIPTISWLFLIFWILLSILSLVVIKLKLSYNLKKILL